MKDVWVNARFLTQQISGVQKFAIELSRELKLLYPNLRFVAPADIIHEDIANELDLVTTGKRKGQLWEQLDLPKFLKKKNSPLLLNFCNSAPLLYKNNNITIHDLAFIENPKWFSRSFRLWYNFLIPRLCAKAKHVFTVSEFSKNELINKLNIHEDNISVIYNGLSSELINYKNNHPNNGPRKDIILSVGSINPRKNIKTLIAAFDSLSLENYELLIVGSGNASFGKEEYQVNNPKIKFLGYIEDQELWELYKTAKLFVYPSLYEGFGIPVLESLYFECPTLVADLEVYKEVYNTFELMYSEGQGSESYARAICKAIKQAEEVKELPIEIIKKCSYQESAEKINQIIRANNP
jgi:glycosyltransferase involved in cell wall biosynthesis